MSKRLAILAVGAAAVCLAGVAGVAAAQPKVEPQAGSEAPAPSNETAEILRRTSPPNPAPDRTYETPEAALIAADIDYFVQEARREMAPDGASCPAVGFAHPCANRAFRAA